jgi:hypothetical protein
MCFDEKDMEPERRERNSATYCPEDDKLRLYCGRVERKTYDELRRLGFQSTPKQSCDFAAVWTVSREDACLRLIADEDDIGAEDQGPEERAADRAERFSGYREKRIEQAGGLADRYEAGPSAFGGQNAARVERLASRRDRIGGRAVSQWSKAEYWQQRTAGVISNALHKSSPSVRRGRVLEIEKDLRKVEATRETYRKRRAGWLKVLELEGGDVKLVLVDRYYIDSEKASPAGAVAFALANESGYWGKYRHPRSGKEESISSLLLDPVDPLTPREAAELWLSRNGEETADDHNVRLSDHLKLRLEYENAMLGDAGGKAADVEMIPGGFVGKHQIQKVNRSPVTKRVVSVEILAPTGAYYDRQGRAYDETNPKPLTLHTLNVERFGENVYRAPTAEELAEFEAAKKKSKAEAKAKKAASGTAGLLNPTKEDAERLQAIWNAKAKAKHDKAKREHRTYGDYVPTAVREMTQAAYSHASKGSYSYTGTRELFGTGELGSQHAKAVGHVCSIRVAPAGGSNWYSAERVIVLTDKPSKPLPLDWETIEAAVKTEVEALAAAPLVLA